MTTKWIHKYESFSVNEPKVYADLYITDLGIIARMKKLCRNCKFMIPHGKSKGACGDGSEGWVGPIVNLSDPACEYWEMRRVGDDIR